MTLIDLQAKSQGDHHGQGLAVQVEGEGRELSHPADGVLGGLVQEVLSGGTADLKRSHLAAGEDGKLYHHDALDLALAGRGGIVFLLLQELAD